MVVTAHAGSGRKEFATLRTAGMGEASGMTSTRDPSGRTRRWAFTVAALLVAGAVGAGLAAFQPWRLWTVRTVSEAAPPGVAAQPVTAPSSSPGAPARSAPTGGAEVLATGEFRSFEHDTSGQVRLVRLADGGQSLRIEHLDTSDGPDVRVWLSVQPVDRADRAGDATWLELGPLRGNRGALTYPLPAGTDAGRFGSVVLWCKRFSVAFGAAPLTPA